MAEQKQTLQRSLGLLQSTSLNMIYMVGIGPFVVLPIVIGMIGNQFLIAWIAGAVLSFIDAMIWSELGTAYPLAGGSYNFLKEAYGKDNMGRMMSFLYVWQTIIQAPLVIASAAIGFSQYLGYLIPLNSWEHKAASGSSIILITILLYRKIDSIGKIGVLLWGGVLLTLGWIIFGGVAHGNFLQPLKEITTSFNPGYILSFAFGNACVKTIYSYLGYYNVCNLGGEIINPGKNIPRSMFISIIGISILYLAMNTSVTSVISWQEIKQWHDADKDMFVISEFFKRLYGSAAANTATVLILWVTLASLFAALLGYSRIPYAAAIDGIFFKVFGKLHPTKEFPYVSLLVIAAIAFIFSLLLKMKEVIDGILAMRIIVQFIGQAIGVVLLRKKRGTAHLPYKMPLYPLPIILAIAIWLFIFCSIDNKVIVSFIIVFCSGLTVYFVYANFQKQWPFEKKRI